MARLALLTIQVAGKEDEQHVYLPAYKKTKRIASGDRTGLFAGTDFAYEDLRAEDLEKHAYRLLGEELVGGEPCWKIEAVAADEEERAESGYARREILVSKRRPIALEVRMYDKKSGALAKVARFSDVRDVGGFPKAHRVEMENRPRESTTVAVATSWVADPDLGREDLTVFALSRGK